MKSKPCTMVSEQFFPKAEEVCKILAACREAGVISFKHGPLEVTFTGFSPAKELTPMQAHIFGPAPTPAGKVPEQTIQAQQRAEIASHEEQEIELRERQIAELAITDPLEAERLMELGETEPMGDENGGEEGE